MFARTSSRCATRLRPNVSTFRPSYARPQCRRFSSPSAAATSSSSSQAGMLAPFVNELDKIAPSFNINGSQIQIIRTPADFYEALKDRIRTAQRRIFLSTLYIGKTEKELIATLEDALRKNPELKLHILTDALRGTREAPDPTTASLLAPLVAEFGADRVEVRMYHTPNLTGARKQYIPNRFNEGWGLQHMKLYGIDDEIILSGANLSTDYFTNRQDRYHIFSSSDVTEYFWKIHQGASSFSFLVQPSKEKAGFALTWPKSNPAPSPLEKPKHFINKTTTALDALISPNQQQQQQPPRNNNDDPESKNNSSKNNNNNNNTRVYMLAQLSQLMKPDTSTELPAITHVLRTLASPAYARSSWTFTAGYFNPAPSLTKLLLSTASTNNVIITASPYANGFYKSPGVSGLLPDAYTLLARRFVRTVHERGRDCDISLKEWRNGTVGTPGGWTYHAKGLWVTLPGDDERGPAMTLVGSSNYTKRSYSHDLEVGALVVTSDEGLQGRLREEQEWLQGHAARTTRDTFATNERRVGLKVRIAMWIVQLVGGAL